jgi:hypothetical protein
VQKLLQVVLSAWREAERVASERPAGSQEHEAALIATDRLRQLYGDLLDSARADKDSEAIATAKPLEILENPS